jgi:hypothetical protein
MQMTILVGFIVVLTLGASVEMKQVVPFWLAVGAYVLGSAALSWLTTSLSMKAMRRGLVSLTTGGSTPAVGSGGAGSAPGRPEVTPAAARWRGLLGMAHQLWMVGGLGAAIWAGYGWWVWKHLGLDPDLSRLPFLWFLAGVAPLLAAAALHWLLEYPLQLEVRAHYGLQQSAPIAPERAQAATSASGERSRTGRTPWTRRDFCLFSFRQDVVMVGVPLALILTFRDCLHLYVEPLLPAAWGDDAVQIVTPVGALVVLTLAPWVIVRAWGTRRLPEGPLRDALVSVRNRAGVSFGEMLIWPTGMNVVNAAVLGIIRPFRYALLTDALVEYMSPREVEAVFHHEVRHVQAHHLFYLMVFIMSATVLCTGVTVGGAWLVEQATGGAVRMGDETQDVLSLALMAAAIVGPFGWVSRRFERQCDTFAAWQMSSPRDPSGGDARAGSETGDRGSDVAPPSDAVSLVPNPHSPVPGPRSPNRVTGEGAAIFCWALQRLVRINCSSLDRRNWRHGSVRWRVEYLMTLSATGGSVDQIDRVVRRIKLCIWGAAAAAAGLLVVGAALHGGS